MDTTAADKAVMTTPLTDVRRAPLYSLSAPETLDRLRPADQGTCVVAAFNSAL